MKLEILAILSTYLVAVKAHDDYHGFYGRHAHVARQAAASGASSSSSSATATASVPSGATAVVAAASAATPAPTPGASDIPPLSQLTSGMPAGTSLPLAETYTAGAVPTYAGAPPLPSHCKISVLRG